MSRTFSIVSYISVIINFYVFTVKPFSEGTQYSKPQSYYRINGLNTVNINISAGRNENTIKVAEGVKTVIDKLKDDLPPG